MRAELPFRTTVKNVRIRNRTFSFSCPAEPADVLDSITNEEYNRDQFLPYWAEQWPSCEVLLPFLDRMPLAEKGASVCEIGSGLGIAAVMLCASGFDATAFEISPVACRYIRANMARNGCRGGVVCADWRHSPFTRRFDLIAGSDILYEERWIEPVLRFISGSVAPDGAALIADPCRKYWGWFLRSAPLHGLTAQVLHREQTNGGKTTVEIAELRGTQ